MGKRRRDPKRVQRRGTTTRDRFETESSFEQSGRFREMDEFDIYADDEWEDELFERQPPKRIKPRRGVRWHEPADEDDGFLERGA